MNDGARSRYRVERKLGQGGVGEVLLAHDTELNRKVALKFLQDDADPSAHKRFLREARSAAAIDHPYICKIYEMGVLDGRSFIALEYVSGSTLRERLAHKALEAPLALRLAGEILEAMSVAHEADIVHRDLKPANIMLTPEGHVKVVDFGLAKPSDDSHSEATTISEVTERGAILGTLSYMSPEQLRAQHVTTAADVFSCGIILYEMFAGVHPFARPTREATTAAILHEDPLPLQRDAIDPRLAAIVHRMLVRDRRQRYASCTQALADLRAMHEDANWQPPRTTTGPSIAVLPFADLSPDGNQAYFCDGLAEELIHALMGIRGLRVAARTSSFRFRDPELQLQEIGERLGTATILEGGVRKSGDQLRITVQLVDLASGDTLWSQRFDRQLDDVLRIQDDIASAIVETLRVRILGEDETRVFGGHTRVLSAHDLYLRGRHEWNTRTRDGLQRSVDYFKLAISDDPSYAQGHAALADAYVLLGVYGSSPPHEVMPLARQAAERALEIRETTGEAHAALACVLSAYDWSWQEAERAFQRALDTNWHAATPHQWYALHLLVPHKRWRKAHAALQVAADLDPLSPSIQASQGIVSYYEGDFTRAREVLSSLVRSQPEFGLAHLFLGHVLTELDRHDKAQEAFERAAAHMGDDTEALAGSGYAFARAGNATRAHEVRTTLTERAQHQFVSPVQMAMIDTALHDDEAAFRHLAEAQAARASDLPWTFVRPSFIELRNDSRWDTLFNVVGLVKANG